MRYHFLLLGLSVLLCLSGCGGQPASVQETSEEINVSQSDTVPSAQVTPESEDTETTQQTYVVVIDPGHQARANTAQEPIGPGAEETKYKVTGGTVGVATGIPEYQLTLTVSKLLQTELEARGYSVILTRESNDVDLSNRERAELANQTGDIFIRIHANGSEDPSQQGAMTLCPTPDNPYPIGTHYLQCRLLSDRILDSFIAATGAQRQTVWETDTMSGINWCQIPVTIIEMGFQSNPQEDTLLNSLDYQEKIVQGIANGVDSYFSQG